MRENRLERCGLDTASEASSTSAAAEKQFELQYQFSCILIPILRAEECGRASVRAH
jgi:hypothetical protein